MSSIMGKYTLTLKHDAGKVQLTVTASSMSSAMDQVMKAERCPRSAIKKVTSNGRTLYAQHDLRMRT